MVRPLGLAGDTGLVLAVDVDLVLAAIDVAEPLLGLAVEAAFDVVFDTAFDTVFDVVLGALSVVKLGVCAGVFFNVLETGGLA